MGFEPTELLHPTVFKTAAINHSAIPLLIFSSNSKPNVPYVNSKEPFPVVLTQTKSNHSVRLVHMNYVKLHIDFLEFGGDGGIRTHTPRGVGT